MSRTSRSRRWDGRVSIPFGWQNTDPGLRMSRYLISRVLQAVLVLWASFTVAFILLQVLPGDAILIKFQSPDMGLSPQQIAEIRASYAADRPVLVQYVHAIGNFLSGDLGYSVQAGVPVSEQLLTNLPPTLWLAGLGFLAASALAAAIAFVSSMVPGRRLRAALQALPALFISM